MSKFRGRFSPILLILIISILGFVLGVLSIALCQENWLITDGILNQDYIYKIEKLTIDKRALFFLCMEKRLRAFFLLFLLAFSTVNIFANVLFFFLSSLYVGSVIELLTIQYGMQGIWMYLVLVLPQGIFYVLGYLTLGCWCLNMEKSGDGKTQKKKDKVQNFKGKGKLITAFVFVFIGIMLESYVNSEIFKIFF